MKGEFHDTTTSPHFCCGIVHIRKKHHQSHQKSCTYGTALGIPAIQGAGVLSTAAVWWNLAQIISDRWWRALSQIHQPHHLPVWWNGKQHGTLGDMKACPSAHYHCQQSALWMPAQLKLEYPKRRYRFSLKIPWFLRSPSFQSAGFGADWGNSDTWAYSETIVFQGWACRHLCQRDPLAAKQKLCLQDIAQEPFLLREKGQRYKKFWIPSWRCTIFNCIPYGECQHLHWLGCWFGFHPSNTLSDGKGRAGGRHCHPFVFIGCFLSEGLYHGLSCKQASACRLDGFIATCRRVCAKIQAR